MNDLEQLRDMLVGLRAQVNTALALTEAMLAGVRQQEEAEKAAADERDREPRRFGVR